MYFKISMRTNPATGVYCGYYRLVESYRNHCDRVCHRTILNAGHLDGLSTDKLNLKFIIFRCVAPYLLLLSSLLQISCGSAAFI
jgi:hypothetical protein